MRRAPLIGSVLVFASAVIVAQQSPAPAPRDPRRELTMSAADGFTLAAVGDCIIARPVSQTPGFAPVGRLIHDADSAFGNFEGTAIESAPNSLWSRPEWIVPGIQNRECASPITAHVQRVPDGSAPKMAMAVVALAAGGDSRTGGRRRGEAW